MSGFRWRALRPGIITSAVALAVLMLGGWACGYERSSGSSGKLNVVATTVQITALTSEVARDNVELRGIIPAGADAHEYEPKPSDLAAIEEAQLIFRHGLGLDDWLDDSLQAGAATVVTVTDGVPLREAPEDGEEVDDPHVWHDPENDAIMVDAIATALGVADPEHKDVYEENAGRYKVKLEETKQQVQAIIDEIPPAARKLVTNHDAFGYFAQAFGLEIVGAVIPNVTTQAEPSARDTAALLETIEREHVKAIFAESSVNPQLARTLANDAGVTIVDDLYGDSLGEPGSGADTIDGMLLANARKIADALK